MDLRLAVLVAITSGAALFPSHAAACTCAVPAMSIATEQADLIVTGRVVRMEWHATTEVIETEIKVADTLRGTLPPLPLRVYAYDEGGGSCLGFSFKAGREYLIFATRNERYLRNGLGLKIAPHHYVTSECGGTIELHNPAGSQRLEEVRKILGARPVQR
jgi:hypothetical protein